MDDDVRQRAMHAATLINERTPADMLRWLTRLLVHTHEVLADAEHVLRDPNIASTTVAHMRSCDICTEAAVVVPLLRNALGTAP